jgi:hypothetical protein
MGFAAMPFRVRLMSKCTTTLDPAPGTPLDTSAISILPVGAECASIHESGCRP